MNKSFVSTEIPSQSPSYKLGMFPGVFTPSILTILGIILFLRMGYTVGHAGFGKTLVLISLASLVSILTTTSLSAIATNIHIKGGGAYYLISRTLGVQYGGAIGLVLFAAQSISIAFYCMGFGEALMGLLPEMPYITSQTIAMGAVVFLFGLAWLGADWATKFQYIVMGLLILALASFFIGGSMLWDSGRVVENFYAPDNGLPFWVLFAIFFPAVTGFTQGVNMSGDLKDPGRAIPLGTFLAVGISTLIYFLVAIIFAGTLPNTQLMSDYGSMKQISFIPQLIDAGVIAATLSSAMASFLGSPRILQSIAKDRIFKTLDPFAKGVGEANNPRRGVLLSGVIAVFIIGLGQLNLIAQVVSMFFLISYGLINYATFFEARAASPSFRPRFRWFSPWLSLAGFIICSGASLAIDMRSGIMAICILIAVYQYLKYRSGPARWADSRRSDYLRQVKENLYLASKEPEHDRDWRPVILAFTNDSKRLKSILDFSHWLEGGSGITAAIRLIKGQGPTIKADQEKMVKELSANMKEINSHAYPLVLAVPGISKSLPVVVQSFGIGPIKANTALINWMDELDNGLAGIGPSIYADNLRAAYREGLNLVIHHANEHRWGKIQNRKPEEQCIDVWWNDDATSRLMLLFAYLMTRNSLWSRAVIRVFASIKDKDGGLIDTRLHQLMEDIRIDAEPIILFDDTIETVIEMSGKSSFVFLPIRIKDNQILDVHGGPLLKLLPYLPMTAMVMAAQDIDLEAEPDTGVQGESAIAQDAFSEANEKYEAAKKESVRMHKKSEAATGKLAKSSREHEEFSQILKDADQALIEEEDAFRREAKAKAKADEAAKIFNEIRGHSTTQEDKTN
ncbi:MAG: amino acid permease [Pseudomonadota bacterium]